MAQKMLYESMTRPQNGQASKSVYRASHTSAIGNACNACNDLMHEHSHVVFFCACVMSMCPNRECFVMDCSSFRRPESAPLRASGGGATGGQNAVQSKKLPTGDGGRADSVSSHRSRTHPRPLSASSLVSFSDFFADTKPSQRSVGETTRVEVKREADAARLLSKPGAGLSRMAQDEIHELRRLVYTKSLELTRL